MLRFFLRPCRIIVNLILVVLPFTALMATLSAQLKSARQATLWAILIWTFLAGIINGFAYYLPALAFLKLLIPSNQLAELSRMAYTAIGLYSASARPYSISLRTLDYGKASAMKSPIIRCKQLSHAYAGKVALSNVNFELDIGEPIGLVGPQWRR